MRRVMPLVHSARGAVVLLLLALALQQLSGAALIKAKAWLAPILIERAWNMMQQNDDLVVKPWPWADTWPVARLRAPAQGVDLMVLHGDAGNALAFGPGHNLASARPGAVGTTVFGGHRDTHFAFLQEVQPGDELQVQTREGLWHTYTVATAAVVDSRVSGMPLNREAGELLLVTCYPFDALLPGGPLRYVVTAFAKKHDTQLALFNRVAQPLSI